MNSQVRWDGHVDGEEDPNGPAQLIRLSDWGFRPISRLWEPRRASLLTSGRG